MAKHVETRKDEVKYTTSDPKEMLNKYLSKRVLKGWVEDFVDEDTAEVVSVERNEVLFDAGALIDNDLLAQIMFYIQSGDIREVEVSNQRRDAFLITYSGLFPYMVSAQIFGKNRKFLLYASSVVMAFEIAKDYIELNHSGSFYISQVKEFNSCTVIEESRLKKQVNTQLGVRTIKEEQEVIIKEYYKIEANIKTDEDSEYTQTFIVKAKDVNDGEGIINDWLHKTFREAAKAKNEPPQDFSITLKSATIFSCSDTIEKEFSLAYVDVEKPQEE